MSGWDEASRLDRLPDSRSPEDLDALWPGAFVLQVDVDGNFAGRDGHPVALAQPGPRRPDDLLLGRVGSRVWFVRQVAQVAGAEATSWRDLAGLEEETLAAATGLARWHALAPLCEACGSTTVVDAGGARRRCPACGAMAFPRLDPAVIIAILDPADRLLLARQAHWPPGRVSIIAGFVEMGESAEQACRRESAEEVGVSLDVVSYVSSQPWPMPRSLMLGFVARAADDRLVPDGTEISEAAWWTRPGLRGALADGTLTLPSGSSIARQLVDAWLEGRLAPPHP